MTAPGMGRPTTRVGECEAGRPTGWIRPQALAFGRGLVRGECCLAQPPDARLDGGVLVVTGGSTLRATAASAVEHYTQLAAGVAPLLGRRRPRREPPISQRRLERLV